VRFPIRLRPSLAERARSPAARRLGVAPSYPSLLSTLTPVAKRLVGTQQHFPGAETLVTELVTLPTHSRVAESDRRHILALLAENGVAP
jgi:dTDP-4-amino-4,6-dideoxygalactose transaminase